ncbi:beta-galactosidase [Paraglaciecola aquimarina]|uniref:Beta-galactosidase n=1 Tax=Paraglaciecola aquimarina TaxID=1235557 RepID=A0ABU3T1C7_9ALTE|nr:beta-galactosidase [Paraglaciecola aquimarina]MDU0356074.1 beta-galactosidase [Paraglaciecola aquimarina]
MLKRSHAFLLILSTTGLGACNTSTPVANSPSETPPQQGSKQIVLADFEEAKLPSLVRQEFINATLTKDTGVTSGKQAIHLAFDSSHEYSTLFLQPEQPWNFSELGDMNLAFDVTNSSDVSVHLYLRVNSKQQNQTRSISIPANSSATYYADLSGQQISVDSGLRADPPAWQSAEHRMPYMNGNRLLDTKAISQISFYISSNIQDKEITLDNVRARTNPAIDPNYLVGLVDAFGQPAKSNYADKVKSDSHLKQLAKDELADLAANPVLTDRSKFGGWKNGPKLKATGFFRTEKVNGVWSLVDPEGYLFFSSGIANIRIANTTTLTGVDFKDDSVRYIDPEDVTPEDSLGIRPVSSEAQKTRYVSSELRHNMFNWLPEYDDALANHYSYRRTTHKGPLPHGETFSFYQANLERRYGERYPESFIDDWQDVTIKRMRSWGMTSFGNWVDPDFYQKDQFPYFANGWIIGDFKTVTADGHGWSPMPDPYDPEFARRAKVTTQVIAEEVKNNPWCIGVFIDNEKSWGNPANIKSHYRIPIQNFKMDASQSPAKAVFTQLLQDKYQDITELNKAWQTNIPSWQSFAKKFDVENINDAMIEDMSMILETYTSQYFKVVNSALREVMPNHLYMGVRMAAWSINPEGVRAAKKYVDVMSYNYYREGMHGSTWNILPEIDMPSIIGEYHFGAMDTGLYHPGLIHSSDQQDRARGYQAYMRKVIDNPYMVGAHWFQYTDSPVTGRAYDGENYNVGFVSNADVPYKEMVEAAREINQELYPRKYKNALK